MIFSLEALQAGKGDSLILHYGKAKAPKFILIDGGPSGVFQGALTQRLKLLRAKHAQSDGKLDLEMLMVSHIDDDHINGVADLFGEMEKLAAKDQEIPYNIKTFWFNSFDETLDNLDDELKAALASVSSNALVTKASGVSDAVVASVGQGRDLRAAAIRLAIPPNSPFDGLVMAPGTGKPLNVKIDGDLTFTILTPSRQRLADLGKEWEKDVKKNPDREVLAAFADKSIPNLSSIVVLAKSTAGTMLLTGDARGDDILAGLEGAKLLKGGKLHVNLLKFPHHGSSNNMTRKFLEDITADHYVISANGEHDNPDAETIGMLCQARGAAAYTVHFTNERLRNSKKTGAAADIEAQVKKVLASHPSPKRKVVWRADPALSVCVNLGDKVNY